MNRKLKLSKTNKIIAGVCGGIAEYINADPTLVRIIWVILTFSFIQTFFLLPMVLYLICWAIIPSAD